MLQAPAEGMHEPDWTAVGLVLSVAGSFLLANAVWFRPPRELVRERFGQHAVPLVAIREHIFHRLQVMLGFGYLVAGFGGQLVGRSRPAAADGFPVLWVSVVVVATALFLALGWMWSSSAFRRYVREHMRTHPPDFESDAALAREVGELFGVDSRADDSVASYAGRVRERLGLGPLVRARSRPLATSAGHGPLDDPTQEDSAW